MNPKLKDTNCIGIYVVPCSQVVKAFMWSNTNIKQAEAFLGNYEDYKFKYDGEWFLDWKTSYRTLHFGDVIIIGYRKPLVISKEEFERDYHVMIYPDGEG